MNKLLFSTILVSSIFLGACNNSNSKIETASELVDQPSSSNSNISPSNKLMTGIVLTVPETDIMVSISSESGPTAYYEDGPARGSVTLLTDFVKPINTTDYIAPIAVNSGGSGVFAYLSAFQPGEASFQMTSTQPLGDRVEIKSVSVEGEAVTATYMDYGPDQAMADQPNVEVTKAYTYNNGILTEVSE